MKETKHNQTNEISLIWYPYKLDGSDNATMHSNSARNSRETDAQLNSYTRSIFMLIIEHG